MGRKRIPFDVVKQLMFQCPFCNKVFIVLGDWDLSVKTVVHLAVYHPDEYKVIQRGQQRVDGCKRGYTGQQEITGVVSG